MQCVVPSKRASNGQVSAAAGHDPTGRWRLQTVLACSRDLGSGTAVNLGAQLAGAAPRCAQDQGRLRRRFLQFPVHAAEGTCPARPHPHHCARGLPMNGAGFLIGPRGSGPSIAQSPRLGLCRQRPSDRASRARRRQTALRRVRQVGRSRAHSDVQLAPRHPYQVPGRPLRSQGVPFVDKWRTT